MFYFTTSVQYQERRSVSDNNLHNRLTELQAEATILQHKVWAGPLALPQHVAQNERRVEAHEHVVAVRLNHCMFLFNTQNHCLVDKATN